MGCVTNGIEKERKNQYLSDDFMNVFNLISHEDKLDEEELFLRTLIAVFLGELLSMNDFTRTENEDENLGEENDIKKIFIAKLLLHFLFNIPQNVHDIAFMETTNEHKWLNSNQMKPIGAGIYVTAALFNHSCDPSFMRCNYGKKIVNITNRNIKKGQEISECYGQMYYNTAFEQRQRNLKLHYKFDCKCLPCVENWPTIKDLRYAQGMHATKIEYVLKIKCTNCSQILYRRKGIKISSLLTCLVCGMETNVENIPLDRIISSSKLAESLLSNECNWNEGIKAAKDAQDIFDKWLVAPNLELCDTQISVWQAMWLIFGNKKIVQT